MLDEMRDMAGQHELVAENVQEKVLAKINQVIRTLKDERRKVGFSPISFDFLKSLENYVFCFVLLSASKTKRDITPSI